MRLLYPHLDETPRNGQVLNHFDRQRGGSMGWEWSLPGKPWWAFWVDGTQVFHLKKKKKKGNYGPEFLQDAQMLGESSELGFR